MREEKIGTPIPSGSIYIGLCQSRAQASALRWQRAVVFIALNVPLANYVLSTGLQRNQTWDQYSLVALASLFGVALAHLWSGMVKREDKWIQFYTDRLVTIERTSGTESSILVFADESFPTVIRDGKQISFKRGLSTLSNGVRWIWYFCCVSACVMAVFTLGQKGL